MSDLVPISVSSPKSDIDDEVIQFLRRQRDQSVITEEMFSCLVANRRKEQTVVGRDASLSAKSEESEFDEEDDARKAIDEMNHKDFKGQTLNVELGGQIKRAKVI